MNWSQYGPAVLAAFLAATVIDALLSGQLLGRSLRTPEAFWRTGTTSHRLVLFAVSRISTAVTCAAFLFVCGFLGLGSLQPALLLAIGVWLAIVLPMLFSAGLYLNLRPLLLIVHLVGWLAKLIVCAGAAFYFL